MVIDKRRGYVRYSDRDKTIVQEIASALDLHDYAREYRLTDGWANVAGFFRDDDPTKARN